ncbi:MAG TPA: hypothetical protein PKI03_15240 [Pseudomonadota bacterium]|nr:hypothetical protein [Pseudomonadota bacterium]
MNIALWTLQLLLSLHTAMGAAWKWSHSEQTVPSLSALPHAVWLSLAGIEGLAAIALLLPALGSRFAGASPLGAAVVTCEMLFFSVVHLASGTTAHGEVVYWLVVAGLAGFLAFARRSLNPHGLVPATP